MPNVWWMPIQTRTEMLATGIRSKLGIKVFGDNLEQIEATAVSDRKGALEKSEGTRSAVCGAFDGRLLHRLRSQPRPKRRATASPSVT